MGILQVLRLKFQKFRILESSELSSMHTVFEKVQNFGNFEISPMHTVFDVISSQTP